MKISKQIQRNKMKKNIKLALGTYLLLSLSSLDAANELTGLGYLNNVTTIDSITTGISSDGSIVVGYDLSDNGVDGLRYEAFRWTEAEGMVGLGDLAGGSFLSNAYGVNSNGTVIVGMSDSTNGNEAFRWTQAGGMVGLGDLAGGAFLSSAYGIRDRKSVV